MRRLLTLLACVALAAAAGCSTGAPADGASEDAAVATVRAYNEALTAAFAEQDMNLLNTTATEDQALTEYYQMAALGEARARLLATLRSVDFEYVNVADDGTAVVVTNEIWDYEHEDIDSGVITRTEVGVAYRLRYHLVTQEGRWLVDRIESIEPAESQEATSTR